VATVLSALSLLVTILFLYVFPFFTDYKLVSLASTDNVAVSSGLLAGAVSLLAIPRLKRLPPAVATVLISLAVGFVPAVACGGLFLFRNGVPQGFAVLLVILLGTLIGGLIALIRPIQIPLATVTGGAIIAIALSFISAAQSTVLVHWLVWTVHLTTPELSQLAIMFNSVDVIVVVTIVTASIVPGVARSPAVAGHAVRAGLLVGLLPRTFALVIGGISWLLLAAFTVESDGGPVGTVQDNLVSLGYSLLGALLGALIGSLTAALSRHN
jgi:uncharacterized membrane protein YjfL (UPF0719 family)